MAVKISSKQEGYYKCGMTHTVEPRTLPGFYFTNKQLDEMQEDPVLTVEIVEDILQEDDPPPVAGKVLLPPEGWAEMDIQARLDYIYKQNGLERDPSPGRCQGINSKGEQCGTKGLPDGELFCEHHQGQADLPKE